MKIKNTDIMQNKVFIRIAIGTGLVLLIPLIAMRFTGEVNWGLGDFVVMGILLFGTGSMFVLVAKKIRKHRAILAIVFLAVFLYIWAELAVGIFTDLGS